MDRADWDNRYRSPDLIWTDQPNRWVTDEIIGLQTGLALDAAAGEGRNSVWLASQGWRVTAVDFSGVGLAKGRELARTHGLTTGQVEWVQADLLAYNPPEHRYNLVLVAYLHLTPPGMAVVLESLAAAVAPGGTLLVIGHDATNLTDGSGGPQDAEVLYAPEDIVRQIPATFEIETAERVQRLVPGRHHAIDALVKAHRVVHAPPA